MPVTFYDTGAPGHGFNVHNFGTNTPTIFSHSRNEYEAQSNSKRRRSACDLANTVAQEAKELSRQFVLNSEMAKLTSDLATYISNKTSSSNYDNIERRAEFVRNCLNAIRTQDRPTLNRLLQEENIAPFKGCFTQRLYNLVKPFQDYKNPFRFLPHPASAGPAVAEEEKQIHHTSASSTQNSHTAASAPPKHTATRERAADSEEAVGPSPLLLPRTP